MSLERASHVLRFAANRIKSETDFALFVLQFQGENATKMLSAYGAFCSKHKDAVAVYKEVLKADKKFTIYVAVSLS